jgi:hypothetical protein
VVINGTIASAGPLTVINPGQTLQTADTFQSFKQLVTGFAAFTPPAVAANYISVDLGGSTARRLGVFALF